jgi:hypothetical protein
MKSMLKVPGLFLGAILAWGPSHASVVTEWNERAVACANRPGGPAAVIDLALVQAAVHDAVQSIQRRHAPYKVRVAAYGTESVEAAAVAAAWRVLSDTRICPASAQPGLLDAYNLYAATADPAGLAVGLRAGASMLNHYRPTPNPAPTFLGSLGMGEWRPTPPGLSPMVGVYLATLEPYVLWRPGMLRPQPPPPLNSRRYQREFDEVRALGSVGSHSAVANCENPKTDLARFWSGNFVAQWNQVSRDLAVRKKLSIGDTARLLALVNLAGADAVIATWDSKLHYNFWRPITAIHEGGEPAWTPFIQSSHFPAGSQNPAYPDYVSGANGITGAYTAMLRLFFGKDDLSFQINRAVPAAVLICTNPRQYSRLSDAAQEVVDARILLGIHFRSADTEGRRLGERVAHWVFHMALQPQKHRRH